MQQVNIAVPEGAIYGFLGPNGAGKTTTMRLLTGLLPDKGEHIRFFNKPLQEQLPTLFHKVGSLIETPSLYLHLSGLDNLRLVARLKQLPEARAKDALNWVGLKDAQHKKAKLYSLGMKQRLAIAMALISDPELLLLDEPVNGLEPGGMISAAGVGSMIGTGFLPGFGTAFGAAVGLYAGGGGAGLSSKECMD